ncbi:hypothetical protein Q5752_001338 [Cryptotrichosporon argae]
MPPPRPAAPPPVLILGGTTTAARALAAYLLEDGRADVTDRFSVNPPTTYLDPLFLAHLQSPRLEYRQVNLALVERHAELFAPPAARDGKETGWKRFEMVFDLTGEIAFDKPELIQIQNTYQLALNLATSAAKLPVEMRPGAYVRLTFSFYEMKSSSSPHGEDDRLRPDGVRGRWWHEALRGLGALDSLNAAAVRSAAWYGRGTWEGEVVPRLVAGHVYAFLKEEMKFLYNADLRIHTVHTLDLAQALYLTALYLLSVPRATALAEAGSDLAFSFAADKPAFSLGTSKRASLSDAWKTVRSVVPEKMRVRLTLFNAVDAGDSTQDSLAAAVARVWGIKYGFVNSTVASLAEKFAKASFSDIIEEANEMHVEAWADMLAKSAPPIALTPITPFLDEHAFRKTPICLDGARARRLLGFEPAHPGVDVDELRAIAKGFQDDNIWPKL